MALIFFFAIQLSNPPSASPAKQQKEKPGLIPAPLLKWPDQGSDFAILVDKSKQKIFLYHMDNLSTPFKVYRCSTGENEGPKSRKNDGKTPEGIYFFTNSYVKRELSPTYGVRAFPIDYPNPLDRKEGRGGYGIWFHGTNKPLKPTDTNGCIVLDNRNIDDLAFYIKLNETPVIISTRVKMVEPDRLQKEARELGKIIESWRRAWEEKNIGRYISFYSSGFTSKGMNWHKWKKYKARLAKKYRRINVEIDNLRLLKNDGLVVAIFDQRYSASGFESQGKKKLYLQQNSKEWKITGEFFKETKKKGESPKKRRLSSLKEIKNFIFSWKKAWEKKDLKTYIYCYDQRFRSRGMDLNAWKRHREKLNREYRSLKIEIRDLKVVPISSYIAKASFKQDYRAGGYHDFGLKKLLLIKKGKHWRIRKEEWQRLKSTSRL